MNVLETALAHHREGRIDAAVAAYRAILAETPAQPDALHMLGVIAQQRGNPALALKLIEAALAANIGFATAWVNRAIVLRAMGRPEDAMESARQGLSLDPSLADAWDILGSALRQQGKYDEAVACHIKAIELQPDNLSFRTHYAVLLLAMGRVREAYGAIDPDQGADAAERQYSLVLGNVYEAAGYTDRAAVCYQKMYELHPELTDVCVNAALARLKMGELPEGFALWQSRSDGMDETLAQLPKWHGQDTDHLVLYEDQGLGDALQMARFVPMVQARVKRLTFYLKPPLVRLFAAHFPDATILPHDAPAPQADARLPMMSLPYIFKIDLAHIPAPVPYLHPPAEGPRWHEKLAILQAPRIGLVWAGNILFPNDRNRSLHFDETRPLLEAARGHMISLQKGPQREQADFAGTGLIDADSWLGDLGDTAGLIAGLDLVIAVDTAVAHLAAAMGKPVWLLLPFIPDWRWMLEREDSPWYPTLRIYRQTAPRDWASVITRVAADAQRFCGGDLSVLRPAPWSGPPALQNRHAIPLS